MMEAVLSVQGLYKRYPGFALEDVSFSLAPKRIMGLIGKNGAGKSTTLKSILNMVSPESGSVKIFQKDFSQYEKECKQRIGVVFGGIDFYPLKKLSVLSEGEGVLAYAGEFYVEPLEVQIEFLKAANGRKWLEALVLRHTDRVRQVSEALLVMAEIKEVKP